jgi:autophagy-related protein 17
VLHERLATIEELQVQFTEYQLSYNKLVVEMGRRLQYREAAENIIRGMIDQLAAMTEGLCQILSRELGALLKFTPAASLPGGCL